MVADTQTWPTKDRLAAIESALGLAGEQLEIVTRDYQKFAVKDDPYVLVPGADVPTAEDIVALAGFTRSVEVDIRMMKQELKKLKQMCRDSPLIYDNSRPGAVGAEAA